MGWGGLSPFQCIPGPYTPSSPPAPHPPIPRTHRAPPPASQSQQKQKLNMGDYLDTEPDLTVLGRSPTKGGPPRGHF